MHINIIHINIIIINIIIYFMLVVVPGYFQWGGLIGVYNIFWEMKVYNLPGTICKQF